MYSEKQQNFLLNLARRSIENYLKTNKPIKIDESEVDDELKENRGVFVTLTINKSLRGCIGHIQAIQPLYIDVIDNAINAAFSDPRFNSLQLDEFNKIKIEISVLSNPEKLEYSDKNDLLKKLIPLKHGVILRKGFYSSTYLPQVWEELSDKKSFLSSLCMKAGLVSDEWEKGKLEVLTYQVEKFVENCLEILNFKF